MSPHPTQPPQNPTPFFPGLNSSEPGQKDASMRFQTQMGRWTRSCCCARARCSGALEVLWWRNRGGMGAATHTPFEKHASKHVLMHLAASQPCQVNGWASGSGLYIPSVLSIVKLQCSLHDYYYTHMYHLVCRYHHGMNIIIVNTHLCGTIGRAVMCHRVIIIWIQKFDYKSFERSPK